MKNGTPLKFGSVGLTLINGQSIVRYCMCQLKSDTHIDSNGNDIKYYSLHTRYLACELLLLNKGKLLRVKLIEK